MTKFRVKQLVWKEVPDGLVAQTIFGPIGIRINPEEGVTYETWFFEKHKKYDAISVEHAKAEARVHYLETLRPALEILVDGPSEQTSEVLSQSTSTVSNAASVWHGNRNKGA